jgi:hypothetical protein
MTDDLVKALDAMTTANQLSTQQNKVLPAPIIAPPIPARVGTSQQTRPGT